MPPASRDDAHPWHAMSAEEALRALGADARHGLSGSEARERLERHGPNRLPEEAREHTLVRLLKQFHNVLIYILLAAAVLTAVLGEWIARA